MENTNTTATEPKTVHPFEKAGLGLAPFRFTGTSREVFVIGAGTPDAHTVPGATCDYCGTAISDAFWIKSHDGKTHKVGCDCIAKLGREDNALVSKAERARRQLEKDKRHARDAARIEAAKLKLARPEIREALVAQPHPHRYHAVRGLTLADYVGFALGCNTTKIQIEASKAIEKTEQLDDASRATYAAAWVTIREDYAREQAEAEQAEAAKRAAAAADAAALMPIWAPVLAVLDTNAQRSDFCREAAANIRQGSSPADWHPRRRAIVIDIYAKTFGRFGSKAYDAAVEALNNQIEVKP